MSKWIMNMVAAIWVTSVILIIYSFLIAVDLAPSLVLLIFAISPFLVIWMVVTVLKDQQPIRKTFEDYFYQDEDIRRNSQVNSGNEPMT